MSLQSYENVSIVTTIVTFTSLIKWPGFEHWPGPYVVVLGKILYSHSTRLST